jgi:hypothetical protein
MENREIRTKEDWMQQASDLWDLYEKYPEACIGGALEISRYPHRLNNHGLKFSTRSFDYNRDVGKRAEYVEDTECIFRGWDQLPLEERLEVIF